MSARMCRVVGVVFCYIFLFIRVSFVQAGVTLQPLGVDKTNPVIGDLFTTQATVSGGIGNAVYYLKCRIGQTSTNLTEGQTYNAIAEKWLDDTSAWIDMPQVTMRDDGSWSGTLPCRIKISAVDESKILFLRACQQLNGACGSSFQSTAFIALTPVLPTATPAPTCTPTVVLVSTKSPTNTPTPLASIPTNTVSDGVSMHPTSFVRIISTVLIEDTTAPDGDVLGQIDEEQTGGTESTDTVSQKKPYVIALLFTGIGLALLAAVSVIKIRYTR